MADNIELSAQTRNELGKGASRRLRREQDLVPAILYGAEKTPQTLTFMHKDLTKALKNEAFHSSILTINIAGKKQKAVLKQLQRHPSKPKILHLDLQRIISNEPITMNVPFNFIGEEDAPGVKLGGGAISHNMSEVEVKCLPNNLPASLDVDVSKLELDEIIHLSNIKLPKGVELTTDLSDPAHDAPVVSVHVRYAAPEEEVVEEAGAAEEEASAEQAEQTDGGEKAGESEKKEKS